MTPEHHFTEKDFTVILNKIEIIEGLQINYQGIPGTIVKPTGHNGPEYCQLELAHPNSHGCKFLEVRKSEFYYMTYPE